MTDKGRYRKKESGGATKGVTLIDVCVIVNCERLEGVHYYVFEFEDIQMRFTFSVNASTDTHM